MAAREMGLEPNRLNQLLLEEKLVSPDELGSAQKTATHINTPLTEVLLGRKIISEDKLGKAVARAHKVSFINLKKQEISDSLIGLIPEEMAVERRVVPFELEGDILRVAMEDPEDLETLEFVRKKSGHQVTSYQATPTGIKYALRFYKKGLSELGKVIAASIKKTKIGKEEVEKLARDVSVIKIVDTLIEYAAAENASDIHTEIFEDRVLVRYRIDGVLHDVLTLTRELHAAIVARVKILADLKLDEHRLPQDGRFKFQTEEGESISLRVSVMPTAYGEKVVLRLLEDSTAQLGLEDLGFSDKQAEAVKREISKTIGMILVTGPTGSGKTTTLYTILGLLNTPEVNIATIEDPIENRIHRINQTQINPTINLGFAEGLRSLLRQDPDIIMVGEIRDAETARIAVNAAMTGHLVLSTLHTNDAPGAVPRLIDLGAEPFLIASTLNLIIAQRLVRTICTDCVTDYSLEEGAYRGLVKVLEEAGIEKRLISKVLPKRLKRGEGCSHCNFTGYRGRTGIFEMLEVTDAIRNLIMGKASAAAIKARAREEGMRTMLEDGLAKVSKGVTTIDEVLRVISE